MGYRMGPKIIRAYRTMVWFEPRTDNDHLHILAVEWIACTVKCDPGKVHRFFVFLLYSSLIVLAHASIVDVVVYLSPAVKRKM